METLTALSRSRSEPASRVSRAAMLLAYHENPSFFAVGQRLGVHHQTVQRCVERAVAYGALAALDDRPRPGKEVRGEGGFDHKRLGNAPAGGVIGQLQGELGRKAKGVLAAHRSQAHKVIRIERDLTRDGT
jgi:hypothetical protein